jgi:hypothetical protein
LISREIELIESSVKNGRIYFPSSDIKFFPADSYADRETKGHKGKTVSFHIGGRVLETDIRISSGIRISPRKSMAFFFRQIGARAGASLKISRLSERNYQVEYIL